MILYRRQLCYAPDGTRIRDTVRYVEFTDRIGKSLAVMQRSFVMGLEVPAERDDYKGAGKPLSWDE